MHAKRRTFRNSSQGGDREIKDTAFPDSESEFQFHQRTIKDITARGMEKRCALLILRDDHDVEAVEFIRKSNGSPTSLAARSALGLSINSHSTVIQ